MARNIELYYLPGSYYSMRVRMYLAEKGVSPKLHLVELKFREHLTEEFFRLNPKMEVPVLKTSDAVVADSGEIYKYGEDSISGDNLIPIDVASDVWRFHDIIDAIDMRLLTFGIFSHAKFAENVQLPEKQKQSGLKMLPGLMKNLSKRLNSAPPALTSTLSAKLERWTALKVKIDNESEVEGAIKSVHSVLGQCEGQLEKSEGPFLFGPTVTVADIDLIVLIIRCRLLGLGDRLLAADQRPKLLDFIAAMEKRGSYQLIAADNETFGKTFRTDYRLPIIGGAVAVTVIGLAIGIGIAVAKK